MLNQMTADARRRIQAKNEEIDTLTTNLVTKTRELDMVRQDLVEERDKLSKAEKALSVAVEERDVQKGDLSVRFYRCCNTCSTSLLSAVLLTGPSSRVGG